MLERVDLGYRVSKDGSHLDAAWSYVSRFLGPDATEAYYDIVTRAFIQAGERFDWAFKAIFQFDLHDLLPRVSCLLSTSSRKAISFGTRTKSPWRSRPKAKGRS